MIGPELQVALFAALKTAAVADGRIYDLPPMDAVYPYVTIGDEQVIDDGSACGAAYEVFADVHVWDRPEGASKRAMKTLMARIVDLAASTELAVDGFRLVVAHLQTTRSRRDPDGQTEHGILTFRYLIDPV